MPRGTSVIVNIGASIGASFDSAVRRVQTRFESLGASVAKAQASNLSDRAVYRSQIADVAALGATLYGAIKPAVDFESAMADVGKVVDFAAPDGLQRMGRDIIAMSQRIPMAADGLAKIVAAAGQSGIAERELLGFAESAAKMGIAFDVSADQAGDMMAKFRTGMKLTQPQVEALADAINELSNRQASSAADVADVVRRQGALALAMGLSGEKTAALASAMLSAGAAPQVAATALKNLVLALGAGESATKSQTDAMSKLGFGARELADLLQSDAQGAIMSVLEALREVPAEERGSIAEMLFGRESLGAIAPLLTNLDSLQSAFALVGDKASYLGSATREFQNRAKTTENGLKLFQNRLNALAITVGSTLLPAINDFLGIVGPGVSMIADLAERFPLVTKAVAGAVVGLAGLKIATLASGYAFTFLKGAALSAAGAVVKAAELAFVPATIGSRALGAAMFAATNPIRAVGIALRFAFIASGVGAVIAGVAAAGTWIYNNWSNLGAMFQGFASGFMAAIAPVRPALDPIIGGVSTLFGWLGNLLGPIEGAESAFMSFGERVGAVVGGVVAKVAELVGGVAWALGKVRDLLPFSDAKTGPLADLTKSGESILPTVGEGVARAGSAPLATPLSAALAGAIAAAPVAASPALPGIEAIAQAPAASAAPAANSYSVNVQLSVAAGVDGQEFEERVRRVLGEIFNELEAQQRSALHD